MLLVNGSFMSVNSFPAFMHSYFRSNVRFRVVSIVSSPKPNVIPQIQLFYNEGINSQDLQKKLRSLGHTFEIIDLSLHFPNQTGETMIRITNFGQSQESCYARLLAHLFLYLEPNLTPSPLDHYLSDIIRSEQGNNLELHSHAVYQIHSATKELQNTDNRDSSHCFYFLHK